jgi:hypothetical protein
LVELGREEALAPQKLDHSSALNKASTSRNEMFA